MYILHDFYYVRIIRTSNWAHPAGTSYLSPFETFLPLSSDQFRKHLKTSLFVSEDNDPGRERL